VARAAARTRKLAKLGALADRMPTIFSLQGTAQFKMSGNANETGTPTVPKVGQCRLTR
jgi:hypothetical protein